MAATDLLELYQSLSFPIPAASDRGLSAIPIPGIETHRLAKDASGSPCLLIRQSPQNAFSAPIRLENLRVSFDAPCTVIYPAREPESDTFTIVRCTAADPALFPHFLRILSPIVTALGPRPTRAAVRRAISGLVELFQALVAPAKKTIQGVWAELFLIRLASEPHTMAAAWHRDPLDHFDFSTGAQRIEVKSSSLRRRAHHFSLAQISPPKGTRVLVASIFVERAGGGVSLARLFEDARARLIASAEATARFDATFYASLGSGWQDAMNEAFDWELAKESLAFFDAGSVPSIATPVPVGVSEVRFSSDLSAAAPLREDELLASGGVFAAAIPGTG